MRQPDPVHSHSKTADSIPSLTSPKEISGRKSPSQSRSRYTIELIVEAASQVLEGHGEAAVTTTAVAERAGVSIGTLYQYFPNRDALLVVLGKRDRLQVSQLLDRTVGPGSNGAPPFLRQLVRDLVALTARRRGARRQYALTIAVTDAVGDFSAREGFEAMIAAALKPQHPGSVSILNEVKSFILVRAVAGVLLAAANEDSPLLESREFEDVLLTLIHATTDHAIDPMES